VLRKSFINKNAYSELVKELMLLAEMEGAQSTCLNIIENLPSDIQSKIVIGLTKTNNPKLISFFQLIAKEATGEIQGLATKALRKYQYLGYSITPPSNEVKNEDVQAFVSLSRLEGACVLVFVMGRSGEYQAHYFSLAFNHLGIKEYFQHTGTNKENLLAIIEKQSLVEIDFNSAQRLLQDAYNQNKRFGTKAASGLSQYQHLLIPNDSNTEKEVNIKLPRLTDKELTPKRIINAYFWALKNMDAALVYDLAAPVLQKKFGTRDDFLSNWVHPLEKFVLIKAFPLSWEEEKKEVRACYQLIAGNENDDLKKIDFYFQLENKEKTWLISEVRIDCFRPISSTDPLNPLNCQVYAVVYKINNYNNLKNFFDGWDKVHLTGEFAGGNCYKWFKAGNPLDQGIDISKEIYGEFILTNQELVIFSVNLRNVTEIGFTLQELINDKTNLKIYLTAKGACQVREVYQVITDPEFSPGEKLLKKNKVYYLDLAECQYWYVLFKDKAKESFMLGSKMQVWQMGGEENILEVLFYKNHGFIFSYNDSMEQWEKILPLTNNLYEITSNLGERDGIEKWQYYKLINNLRKDTYTRVFVPHDSQWELTKKLRITNEKNALV